tara:strand:- start:2236 stop:3780 length:1545 start_codon:yes stop_codon:yes gene_type:complete
MDKIFKLQSRNSDTITSTQNLVDFDIPSNEVLDLSKSYVSLIMKAGATITNITAADNEVAVANVSAVISTTDTPESAFYVPAVGLVKNANLYCRSKGRLEEIRNCNVLRCNQQVFEKSLRERVSDQITNCSSMTSENVWGSISPLIRVTSEDQTNNTGNVAMQYLDKEVRIPLRDIYNLGSVDMFDTGRLGETQMHLELDVSRLVPKEMYSVNPSTGFFHTGKTIGELGIAVDADATAGEKTSLVLTQLYNQADYKDRLPFYVGCPIAYSVGTLKRDAGDINLATATVSVVTNITYDASTKKVTLTLNTSLGNSNANGITGVKIKPAALTGLTVTIDRAELTLHAKTDVKESELPSQMDYTTYSLERDNGNGVASFKKTYEIEPNAVNMVAIVKEAAGGLYADNTDPHLNWRVTIDNEASTNRNVYSNSTIAFERTARYYLNQGKQVHSLSGTKLFCNPLDVDSDRTDIQKVKPIFETLPLSDRMKLVEIEINTPNTGKSVGEIDLFKEVTRSV